MRDIEAIVRQRETWPKSGTTRDGAPFTMHSVLRSPDKNEKEQRWISTVFEAASVRGFKLTQFGIDDKFRLGNIMDDYGISFKCVENRRRLRQINLDDFNPKDFVEARMFGDESGLVQEPKQYVVTEINQDSGSSQIVVKYMNSSHECVNKKEAHDYNTTVVLNDHMGVTRNSFGDLTTTMLWNGNIADLRKLDSDKVDQKVIKRKQHFFDS